ncbi:protein of unknown function [Vibrio tapetis subsp. tapetis]|uniref:Uncharacterized protein n=1 Tax=Vibrio tapetis subsp. tapetis TaxID=1671868 RepID=A0A2N8ZIT0_9VIBR|nr:protein of unknown function [Vibrio tapetis subsp. tapetis]
MYCVDCALKNDLSVGLFGQFNGHMQGKSHKGKLMVKYKLVLTFNSLVFAHEKIMKCRGRHGSSLNRSWIFVIKV